LILGSRKSISDRLLLRAVSTLLSTLGPELPDLLLAAAQQNQLARSSTAGDFCAGNAVDQKTPELKFQRHLDLTGSAALARNGWLKALNISMRISALNREHGRIESAGPRRAEIR
jgi:hypothetical protein